MIKAVVTDLDDTLLRRDKTVSAFTRQTLAACARQGVKLLYATARGGSAEELVPGELFTGRVLLNGAYAEADGHTVYERRMEPEVFLPFLRRVSALRLPAAAEIGGVHFANFDVSAKWPRRYVLTGFADSDFTNAAMRSEKLYVVVETPEQAQAVRKWLPAGLRVHFTKDNLALITHGEAAKALALAAVLARLGIAFADTVAFGDDLNDKEMLQACGVGVAMANAPAEVKQAADCLCGDCDADGAARWLAEHL